MYSALTQSSFFGSKVAGFLEMRSSENLLARTSRGMIVVLAVATSQAAPGS